MLFECAYINPVWLFWFDMIWSAWKCKHQNSNAHIPNVFGDVPIQTGLNADVQLLCRFPEGTVLWWHELHVQKLSPSWWMTNSNIPDMFSSSFPNWIDHSRCRAARSCDWEPGDYLRLPRVSCGTWRLGVRLAWDSLGTLVVHLTYPLVIQRSHAKWPIYRWFSH